MAEKVGELYYDVTLDTAKMIEGQRKVDRELGKTTASIGRFAGGLTAAAAAVAVLAAAMAAVQSAKMADEFRLLGARVNVAAGSIERGAEAMKALQSISVRTQTSLEANADVFGRLNQSLIQMGGTQQDTLRLTELLGMAIKVSGASAVEAKSAMLQFGQALGSGKLAGDELRSLLENAPYLMRQLADGIGVPVGALKQLGEDGKLTADVIVEAMGKAAGRIEADFATFPQTIAGAMQVIEDQAQRANKAFDDMTGTSAKLAGVAQGLGTVIGELADQFEDATDESDKLGRNDEVKTWAKTTANILTYVADAADGVVRSVKQVGLAIGGMAAAAAAVARGEFSEAKTIINELQADSEKLWMAQLSGEKMRAKIAAGGSVKGASGPFSALKNPAGDGDGKKKKKGAAFDSAGYLAGLRKDQATEMGVINETEAEKLRIAQKHLTEKKIGEAQYQEAVSLITQTAEQDRAELMRKTQEDINRDRLEADRKAAQERADIERNRLEARQDVAFDNPAEQVRIEEEQRLAAVEAARQLDLANTQLYEEQKIAIQRWAAEERAAIQQRELDLQVRSQEMKLSAMANLASGVYALIERSGKEQSALGKAAFLAQKAITVAQIIMSTNAAAAAALAPPPLGAGPIAGAGLAAMIKGTGYASAGLVAGMAIGEVAGGRQYGGPVSAGSLYRVNEGGAPEMFQGSNGSQYMMPTKSGQVVPAGEVGGGGGWTINILNAPPGTTAAVNDQARIIDIAVGRAKAEIAGEISSNTGQVWSALRGGSDLKPRM